MMMVMNRRAMGRKNVGVGAQRAKRSVKMMMGGVMRATRVGVKEGNVKRRMLKTSREVVRVRRGGGGGGGVATTTTAAAAAKSEAEADGSVDGDPQQAIALTRAKFRRVLCANRGEIAVRVFRAVGELGLQSIAVYSSVDRLAAHRYKADYSYNVGTATDTPVGAYLNIESVVNLAKQHRVDAIHPGYGFLSENANLARRCAEEGITFVGPLPETLDALGDKTAARALAESCGIPVVPGTPDAVESLDAVEAFCEQYGFPVILKAAMGGGGRGMRVVRNMSELPTLFERASSEALSAFGDGRVFVERYVERPRHIEIQILADSHGNVVHLHERDCSVQRRHQKVVEIAPAPNLNDTIRQALFRDAVAIAKGVNYRNAGTVEFIVDEEGRHYFLEVNPRIQVEHTVTEEISGVDLVQAQICIAAGASLPELGLRSQDDVVCRGFAIQCRITSEDAAANFRPDIGRVDAYRPPGGLGIRLDSICSTGAVISPHYDSLLLKLTASSSSYESSIRKMRRALGEFAVRGVKTNVPFLRNVVRHPTFVAGKATTAFIEEESESLFSFGLSSEGMPGKILGYLADCVVNGTRHPGATGTPPPNVCPEPPDVSGITNSSDEYGWRKVLLESGPEGFAKRVREHSGVLMMDTTWRDAHQSLLATRMRTYDLSQVAPATSAFLSNAFALEMWGGATFDVSMRFLHECPWERLETLRQQVPNIPFQMLFRGANAVGYTTYADNVVREFVKEAKKFGIDIFRVFDSLNYIDNLKFGIDAVVDAGGVAEATICYTGDVSQPLSKYSLDYYLKLTRELVKHGIHILAIKDMAGLLTPYTAKLLVSSLRAEFPDIPIHVHTHDTAGMGVASMLAAAQAGADVVDAAVDSMSGLTSQPSMGAIAKSLRDSPLDCGIDAGAILKLSSYWEQVRQLYSPFESGLLSGSSDVYVHEMPGGQYTNLKFQAQSLGLGNSWEDVKISYAAANRVLGNIVKVTPSSKVVGDLAQFMVANKLDEESLLASAGTLSFPTSVVEYFQGYLGQPYGGFPEGLRDNVLKDKERINGRPGASMPDVNLYKLQEKLVDLTGRPHLRREVLSSALYPKVYEEFVAHRERFGDVYKLPTKQFLDKMKVDEEVSVQIEDGVDVTIKLKAVGELLPSSQREVFFEINGIPRSVIVDDQSVDQAAELKPRDIAVRADAGDLGSVGAPMAGEVIQVSCSTGKYVEAGSVLLVLSAMKMETSVAAPISGVLQHVAVEVGNSVSAGDLLVKISPKNDESSAAGADVTADVAEPAAA